MIKEELTDRSKEAEGDTEKIEKRLQETIAASQTYQQEATELKEVLKKTTAVSKEAEKEVLLLRASVKNLEDEFQNSRGGEEMSLKGKENEETAVQAL